MYTKDNSKTYTGTKTILAWPMDRAAYSSYRGWALPADEDGADPGYLVEYTDGGKPNSPNHDGYISWSPADVFERAYVENVSGNWRTRVVEEHRALDNRLFKLFEYINGPLFEGLPRESQRLLIEQAAFMASYLDVLEKRLISIAAKS